MERDPGPSCTAVGPGAGVRGRPPGFGTPEGGAASVRVGRSR